MSWLTFHNGGFAVRKGPVDMELNRHRLLIHRLELGNRGD